ncbi:MAG: BatA domain-containing protein [Planctomycetes bacterium]|nr:BatA domain-containing protein [Planctomycetota bacterium]
MGDLLRLLFLNPGMLAGTLLVAVPIIIYLINRQRYERRRWAAMEFLLRAMRRNRRRIQLQNLLLLLVRTAVVFLVVLAAARPVSRLGILSLSPRGSQSWVLALDASYSMGYQEDSKSLFDRARETIAQVVESLVRPGDQFALVTLERRPRIVLGPTAAGDDGRSRLRRELEDLAPSTGAVDLGASLALLDEVCGKLDGPGGEPRSKRIVVFSDLQRRDWLDEEGPRAGLIPAIDKIVKEGGEFVFARLSSRGRRPNLAITDLAVVPALVAKDVWVELRATLRNFGEEDFSGVDFTLRVDADAPDSGPSGGAKGAEPQVGEVIRVAREGTDVRRLAYRFATPGYHTVTAELRSDGLLVDNRRHLAVRVEDSVKVLLVDGDPSPDPLERETFHLEVALQPDDDALGAVEGRFTPFETHYVTPDQLGSVAWKEYPVVILAGVAELPPDQAAAVKDYVRGGGALIVFLGPTVRPEAYNQAFRGEEPSLLPVALEDVRGDKRFPVSLEAAELAHPLVAYFEQRKEFTHLQRPVISFQLYYRVSPIPEGTPGVRVPFRYTDTARGPAIIDNAYGSGRAMWVTSTASLKWNELASWPDFVVFLYEAISYLVRFGSSTSNLTVGETFRRTYPASQYAQEVLLLEPEGRGEGDRFRSVPKAMKRVEGSGDFELEHEDTEAPGIYRLELKRPSAAGADSVERFAANVDTAESDLTAMAREDFETHFQTLGYQEFNASERIEEVKEAEKRLGGREHWRWIIAAVLGLLVLETVLAWLFGRRSR